MDMNRKPKPNLFHAIFRSYNQYFPNLFMLNELLMALRYFSLNIPLISSL